MVDKWRLNLVRKDPRKLQVKDPGRWSLVFHSNLSWSMSPFWEATTEDEGTGQFSEYAEEI